MFYQGLDSPPPADEEAEEEKYDVVLRRRSGSSPAVCAPGSDEEKREAIYRPRTWSKVPESLEKIEEGVDESDAVNPCSGYNLSGYLYKVSSPKKPLKGFGSWPKKMWFVYSDSVCKLYYYKQKNDPKPHGVIDISLASFFFDPESKNEGQFSIRWDNKEMVLEASSAQGRMYWVQKLQRARREFSQRRTATSTPASRTTSTGRPETGLIQEDNAHEADIQDPHHDLERPVMRPVDSDLPPRPHSTPLSEARLALSNLLPHTPKMFKSSPSSESLRSPVSPHASRNNIATTPTEDLTFGSLGRRLRSSLRVRKTHEAKEATDITNVHKPATCKKCEELQAELTEVQEEQAAIQDEYQASREVISVLQKELETLQQEKATLISLDRCDLTDHHVIEILRGKDRRIVNLEHEAQVSTNKITGLEEELSRAQMHHEHLNEKLSMLYCLVEAKDKAIVSLTHEIDAVKPPTPTNFTSLPNSSFYCYPGTPSPTSCTPYIPEFVERGTQTLENEEDVLKDSLQAYKDQNLFLNKEILELNLLRKHAADREDKLITESSEWEAKFYQIQSKYLLLLNELHSPQANQHDRSIVSQLLQDVVGSHDPPALKVIQSKGREYDEYGFCISVPDDGTVEAKAAYLQRQSKAIAQQLQKGSSSWESKWESILAGTSAKELPTCPELKYIIREGIPYQYKGKVWRLLIDAKVQPLKAALLPNYYQDLLARHTSFSTPTLDPACKQIDLDLLRTLPNNRHYETIHSDGIAKLKRVLLAFSKHNPQVGYCQGLNRLAAIALLLLNEEDAFWCLVYIVEYLMPPDYYNKNLLGSQVDQRVLKDLVAEKLPRLSNHLARYGLDISLFTFNWFLCVYIDIIPPFIYLTIWDSFLYEGSKVLFRFALAIFKLCEEAILERCDYMEIFTYLRSLPDPITNISRLQEVAFQWINPLSKSYLRARRAHHTAIVRAELEQVERQRAAYHTAKASKEANKAPSSRPPSPENSPPSTDDEGEGDSNYPSSPSSPSSPQAEGGPEGVPGRERLHFGALGSVVFERKDEVSHKIDEASVEGSDKGRE